jgi:O-methyltransferase
MVIEGASEHIEKDLLKRCELVAGDFFQEVPQGASAYLIKQCLHNWDDEHCIKILKTCRRAMTPNSKFLMADRVITPDTANSPFNTFNKYWDLIMMAVASGRERTQAELHNIYAASGLKLTRIIPTGTPLSIIEGIPV